jgi:hypothetical protein
MIIEDTRQIVLSFFKTNRDVLVHRYNKKLVSNEYSFQIKPDDAFYFQDKVIIVEYENNLRPVESISKYFWLFKNTEWSKVNFKMRLLLTINNKRLAEKYKIRTESIKILGAELQRQYPILFDFYFLSFADLNQNKIFSELNKMTT